MSEDVKYKKVDKWVYWQIEENKLIGEDNQAEKGLHQFVCWNKHNNQHRSTNVSHKELFEWFKIDQAEFDKKFMEDPDQEDKLEK